MTMTSATTAPQILSDDLAELRELVCCRVQDKGSLLHLRRARESYAAGTFTTDELQALRLHLLQLPLIPAEHAPF